MKSLLLACTALVSLTLAVPAAQDGGDSKSNLARPRGEVVPKIEKPIVAALDYLVASQSDDGHWESDGSAYGEDRRLVHDVGLTGLALLTFLECGVPPRGSEHAPAIKKAIQYLRGSQDFETGLYGQELRITAHYDHAIATLAMAEAAAKMPDDQELKASVEAAVVYILRARNPYGAWRYDSPPIGDNDTSITTWMVLALNSAEHLGIAVDREAYTGAWSWIQEVTDPETGRVGYSSQGSPSSRIPSVNEQFPVERGEAMTGCGIVVGGVLGKLEKDRETLKKQTGLLLRKLPEWAPSEFDCDMYYWYFGTLAMRFTDPKSRRAWNTAILGALKDSQSLDPSTRGSWDPVGPWGGSGGRTYSTALSAMAYRYAMG